MSCSVNGNRRDRRPHKQEHSDSSQTFAVCDFRCPHAILAPLQPSNNDERIVNKPTNTKDSSTKPTPNNLICQKCASSVGVGVWSFDPYDIDIQSASVAQLSDQPNRKSERVLALVSQYYIVDLLGLTHTPLEIQRLCQQIEEGYDEVVYHNRRHAAATVHAFVCLIKVVLPEIVMLSRNGDECARVLLLACVIAAAGHDYGHPGVTSQYLINTEHNVAKSFNGISVLESYHSYNVLLLIDETLFRPKRSQSPDKSSGYSSSNSSSSNAFVSTTKEEFDVCINGAPGGFNEHGVRYCMGNRSTYRPIYHDQTHEGTVSRNGTYKVHKRWRFYIKQLVARLILATDMSQHGSYMTVFDSTINSPSGVDRLGHHLYLLLELLIKAADLSGASLSWSLHLPTSVRVAEEFYRQGDMEAQTQQPISAMCDRSETTEDLCNSQKGFLRYVVRPLFCSLNTGPLKSIRQPKQTRFVRFMPSRRDDVLRFDSSVYLRNRRRDTKSWVDGTGFNVDHSGIIRERVLRRPIHRPLTLTQDQRHQRTRSSGPAAISSSSSSSLLDDEIILQTGVRNNIRPINIPMSNKAQTTGHQPSAHPHPKHTLEQPHKSKSEHTRQKEAVSLSDGGLLSSTNHTNVDFKTAPIFCGLSVAGSMGFGHSCDYMPPITRNYLPLPSLSNRDSETVDSTDGIMGMNNLSGVDQTCRVFEGTGIGGTLCKYIANADQSVEVGQISTDSLYYRESSICDSDSRSKTATNVKTVSAHSSTTSSSSPTITYTQCNDFVVQTVAEDVCLYTEEESYIDTLIRAIDDNTERWVPSLEVEHARVLARHFPSQVITFPRRVDPTDPYVVNVCDRGGAERGG